MANPRKSMKASLMRSAAKRNELACIANNERVDILAFMTKHVADLSLEELDRLAAEAWFDASQSALKAGVAGGGRGGGKIVKKPPRGGGGRCGGASPPPQVQD